VPHQHIRVIDEVKDQKRFKTASAVGPRSNPPMQPVSPQVRHLLLEAGGHLGYGRLAGFGTEWKQFGVTDVLMGAVVSAAEPEEMACCRLAVLDQDGAGAFQQHGKAGPMNGGST
jgi:hypothetical protein